MHRSESHTPLVTVGLPVFNGEEYLRQALQGILEQEFTDFELLISDNASTDTTQAICEEFVGSDSRVSYHRHEANIGLTRNFNSLVARARTPYFMWIAYDDRIAPGFIRRCIDVLESDPGVVLCHSLVRIIDHKNRELAIYDSALHGAASDQLSHRLSAIVMHRHLCTDMFGLMRRDKLLCSELLKDFNGSDRGFLAEMALLGRFAQIDEPLFENREHGARLSRLTAVRPRTASGRLAIWKLYRQYRRIIRQHVADQGERRACQRVLLRWWFTDWNFARIGVDLIGIVWPGVYGLVNRLKIRLYGQLPQIHERQ